jgi:hypothetical protein
MGQVRDVPTRHRSQRHCQHLHRLCPGELMIGNRGRATMHSSSFIIVPPPKYKKNLPSHVSSYTTAITGLLLVPGNERVPCMPYMKVAGLLPLKRYSLLFRAA